MNSLSKIGTTLTAVFILLTLLGNSGWIGQILLDSYLGAAYQGVFILSNVTLIALFFILTRVYNYQEYQLIFIGLFVFILDNLLGLGISLLPVTQDISFVDVYYAFGGFISLAALGIIIFGIQKHNVTDKYLKYFVIAYIVCVSIGIILSWSRLFYYPWVISFALNAGPFAFLYMHFKNENKFEEEFDILDE